MYEPVKFSRVHLPRRTDAPVASARLGEMDIHPALVQALADRIGSLPGVSRYPVSAVNNSTSLRFYMDSEFTLETSTDVPVLFADLDPAGRVSLKLSPDHEVEIIRSGWGQAEGSRIVTLPPRDIADVTILWRITLMSYFDMASQNNFDVWREFRTAARTIPAGSESGSPGLVPGAFF